MGWQPIETAPKDGTEIDMYAAICKRIPDCKWRNGKSGHGWYFRGDNGWEPMAELKIVPTHWMAVPDAPHD